MSRQYPSHEEWETIDREQCPARHIKALQNGSKQQQRGTCGGQEYLRFQREAQRRTWYGR